MLSGLKTHVASQAILKKWDKSFTKKDVKNKLNLFELRILCNHFELEENGEKDRLIKRLWDHWENSPDSESDSESDTSDSGEETPSESDTSDSESD